MTDQDKGYEGYAILELMGHRRLCGRLSEATIAGAAFIRIDVPDAEGLETTQFYAPQSVYCITPTTEDVVRRAAKTNSVQPVSAYELRERTPVLVARPARDDDSTDYDEDLEDLRSRRDRDL